MSNGYCETGLIDGWFITEHNQSRQPLITSIKKG